MGFCHVQYCSSQWIWGSWLQPKLYNPDSFVGNATSSWTKQFCEPQLPGTFFVRLVLCCTFVLHLSSEREYTSGIDSLEAEVLVCMAKFLLAAPGPSVAKAGSAEQSTSAVFELPSRPFHGKRKCPLQKFQTSKHKKRSAKPAPRIFTTRSSFWSSRAFIFAGSFCKDDGTQGLVFVVAVLSFSWFVV